METPVTDKQKAKELAHDYFRRGQLGLAPAHTECAGYECAMKAMEWKENQTIEKAWKFIDQILTETGFFISEMENNNLRNELKETFILEVKKG